MDAPAPRKPALGFIFVTLVFLVLGFGIIIPVLPGLVTQFEGGNVAQGSDSYGLLVGVFAVMQFIASPILGSLSDRFGRRKIILVALAGTAIDYVIMGLAPNIKWMFVGRMISGVTAGALATCNAYVADVTTPEKRAQGYGLVGAAFGLGFVIGPAIGGLLGDVTFLHPFHVGRGRLPFFVAAACVGIDWLYGAFVLPESLPVRKQAGLFLEASEPASAPSWRWGDSGGSWTWRLCILSSCSGARCPEHLGSRDGLQVPLDDGRSGPVPDLHWGARGRRAGRARSPHHRPNGERGGGLSSASCYLLTLVMGLPALITEHVPATGRGRSMDPILPQFSIIARAGHASLAVEMHSGIAFGLRPKSVAVCNAFPKATGHCRLAGRAWRR